MSIGATVGQYNFASTQLKIVKIQWGFELPNLPSGYTSALTPTKPPTSGAQCTKNTTKTVIPTYC